MSHTERFSLSGRRALITGAAKGLGWEIARAMAEAGAEVYLNGRNLSPLEERCRELTALGLVAEAWRIGAPKRILAPMVGNVILDATVGVVPFVGDLFDFVFKANTRNALRLRVWWEKQKTSSSGFQEPGDSGQGPSEKA